MRAPFARSANFREQGRMGRHMRGHRGFSLARLVANPEARKRLGITTEQATKIRQLDFDFRKARIRNRADLEVQRLELSELLASENADRTQIYKKLREISDSRYTAEKSAIDYRLALGEVLTPEQREKMKAWRYERRNFDRSGPGGGERMGRPSSRRRSRVEPQTPTASQKPATPNQ